MGSKEDVRIPSKITPRMKKNTKLPPAIFRSSEMENKEEVIIGAKVFTPDDTICAIPFADPKEALEGQVSTTRTRIDPGQPSHFRFWLNNWITYQSK